jgi:excisionase family DNA binding protein
LGFLISFPEMDREILTKTELMEYLRISRGTVDNWMKKQGMPFFKVEKKVLFRKSNIDTWLESKVVRKGGIRAK